MQHGTVVINPDGNWREVESKNEKCISKGIQFETPFDHIPSVKLQPDLLKYSKAIVPSCSVDETDRSGFIFRFCIEQGTTLLQPIIIEWTAE